MQMFSTEEAQTGSSGWKGSEDTGLLLKLWMCGAWCLRGLCFLWWGSGCHWHGHRESMPGKGTSPLLTIILIHNSFENRIMELLKVKGSMKTNDPISSFDEYILWRNNNKLTPPEHLLNARPCSKWFTVGICFSFHNTIIDTCYYYLYFK